MTTVALALLVLLPLAAFGQGADEWEQQVRDQLAMASADLRDMGYVAAGQPVVGASDAGVVERLDLSLVNGVDYVVVGVCDADCTDLDLRLVDGSGAVVADDIEEDDYPVLEVSPRGKGGATFTLQIGMVACASEPCAWGVGLFVAGEAPGGSAGPPAVASSDGASRRGGFGRRGQTSAPSGGWTERGSLGAGDETLQSGEYLDAYELEGVPGRRLRVDMSSQDFDTYLILVAPSGEQLENDDAPGQPGHSVLETVLEEAGTYQVLATSYERATGRYDLVLDLSAAPTPAERQQLEVVPLSLGARQTGALEPGDLALEGGELADLYEFDGRAGQGIVLEMSSRELDTYLGLLMPDGAILENDDVPQREGVSVIELALPMDGRYQVVATSYRGGERGCYELSLRSSAQPLPGPGARHAAADSRVLALLVGISDYPGDEQDLSYTAEDAVRIRDALLAGAGMRPEDGILLTDSEATVANVSTALATLGSRLRPSDLLVFFYSGHGNRVPRSDFQPSDPDSFDETLALYDGELTDDELAALLDRFPTGQTLLVLDSCFSGGFAKDVISAPNRMGLFSSEEDVTSQVAAKFRAGGFLAVFLADAIGGGHADDGDGELTALEISQYLYERYRSDVKSTGAGDYVRTGGPRLGYQHLVVDRGSISPYHPLFRLVR